MGQIEGEASVEDTLALRRLAENYASAADRRDAASFWGVFDDEVGVLKARSEVRGLDGAAKIMERLSQYARTFHFIGNTRYETDGDTATGEVYCMAHHLTPGPDSTTNFRMYMRYEDLYIRRPGRAGTGGWRIHERRFVVDWTETVIANAPGAW